MKKVIKDDGGSNWNVVSNYNQNNHQITVYSFFSDFSEDNRMYYRLYIDNEVIIAKSITQPSKEEIEKYL